MCFTGGYGPSARNESFTREYDLPNDTCRAETCASCALVFRAARMLNLDLDGEYFDLLKLALHNNALSGLSRQRDTFSSRKKLGSDGSQRRWEWHRCPCCTMKLARPLAWGGSSVSGFDDSEIDVHLQGPSETQEPRAGARSTSRTAGPDTGPASSGFRLHQTLRANSSSSLASPHSACLHASASPTPRFQSDPIAATPAHVGSRKHCHLPWRLQGREGQMPRRNRWSSRTCTECLQFCKPALSCAYFSISKPCSTNFASVASAERASKKARSALSAAPVSKAAG